MLVDSLTIRPNESLAEILAREPLLPPGLALQVVRQLAQQVRTLHVEQRWLHRGVGIAAVAFDDQRRACLGAGPASVRFGGPDSDPEVCPPELQGLPAVELPANIGEAQTVLRSAGVALDARRIDVYQLGSILCRLAVGVSVSAFLRSPRAASQASAGIKLLIETTLGYDAANRFDTVEQFLTAIEQSLTATPSDEESPKVATGGSRPSQSRTDTPPRIDAADRVDTAGASSRAPAHADLSELPFRTLGHYEIIGRIGHGGMGDVYQGYERKLGRTVAIKVLPPELARQEDFVRRFYAEASAAATLIHPNIIQIYFIGEESCHETLAILEQALAGLTAAHQRKLVHRDIKPGNLLIDAEHRRVLLADFGLVKSVAENGKFTATGVVMGTVDYISPEQGRGQAVDGRSDLYALGVVAYQMLAGCLPFAADSPTAMIFQHVYERPRALREVAPHVPAALAAILEQLLAKSADERQQTAEEVLADLQAFRTGQPRPSFQESSQPPVFVTDVEVVRERPPTAVIRAPRLDDAPLLPAHLLQRPETSFWVRTRDRMWGRLQAHAPGLAARVQKTEQLMRGAVAEYERRRDQVQALVGEAEAVYRELTAQRDANRAAAIEAAQAAEVASDEPARQAALARKDEGERTVQQLEVPLAEQQEQLEDLRVKLAQLNATLGNLRAQRDVLQARLHVARARVQHEGGKPAGRRRRLLLPAVLLLLGVPLVLGAIYTAKWVWHTVDLEQLSQADVDYLKTPPKDRADFAKTLAAGPTPADAAVAGGKAQTRLVIPGVEENKVGEVCRFGDLGWGVESLAFSPDGALLAVGKMDRALLVYDIARKTRTACCEKLESLGQVTCVAFSPDGS
ncbi:MAG: protein kinase, partial [Planctomycetota bacterium]|nr:protein kinase [Planctomycetota bacterium]